MKCNNCGNETTFSRVKEPKRDAKGWCVDCYNQWLREHGPEDVRVDGYTLWKKMKRQTEWKKKQRTKKQNEYMRLKKKYSDPNQKLIVDGLEL